MINILDMSTVQIETTNCCRLSCSNCTRFVGHHKKPYFMEFSDFKKSVDSLIGYSHHNFMRNKPAVGFQGGEPLLHPDFERMCEYAASKIGREHLGLWTTFPQGKEHYREIIVDTFKYIFVNDHTRKDIYHHPALIPIEEVITNPDEMWYYIDHCEFQKNWSASVNPKGAYFCEMAASFAMLYPESPRGWNVEPGWWKRTVKDYKDQIEYFCPKCGMACPLKRRASVEGIDDISPSTYEKLKDTSPKIKNGKYEIHNLKRASSLENLAAYKNLSYRDNIAKRYGIFLMIENNYWVPYLFKDKEQKFKKSKFYSIDTNKVEITGLLFSDKEFNWLNFMSSYMDSVVEIGCWKGGSTFALLNGCKGPVYAIDHFLGNTEKSDQTYIEMKTNTPENIYQEFLKNVGHFENLKIMKMSSNEAVKSFAPKSVDMVFIDGDHSYDIFKQDLENWLPIAKKMICGHDYHLSGVQKVLIEKFSTGKKSKDPLSKYYFKNGIMKNGTNPANDLFLEMIPNFRTIPGTTIWVYEILKENKND